MYSPKSHRTCHCVNLVIFMLEHTHPAEFANQFLQEVTITHRDSKY